MSSNLLAVNIGDASWGSSTLKNTFPNFGTIVKLILQNSITIASIVLLALLIFGGVTFIINAGANDPKKTQQSQQTIQSALIGFVVVLFAYVIIQIIEVVTGLNILNSSL